MNKFILAFCLAISLIGCQKEVALNSTIENAVVVSDALAPLKFHATGFLSNYSTVNNVPPFSFTKTLYGDTRVSSIKMNTRSTPNYPGFVPGNYYWEYKLSYSTNAAFMSGRRIRYANGIIVNLLTRNFGFTFNKAGFVTNVIEYSDARGDGLDLHLTYTSDGTRLIGIADYQVDEGTNQLIKVVNYDVINDIRGNIIAIKDQTKQYHTVAYTYNLNSTGNNYYLYQSTQYAISQWFSFLESMQWIPSSRNERATVILKFPNTNGVVVTQSQNYINHKYDVNGNLISYTYGDGVPQKITWK